MLNRLLKHVLTVLLLFAAALALTLAGFRLAAAARESQDRHAAAPRDGRFIPGADVELYVQESGPRDGPTLVFLSGLGAWSETWRPTMAAMARAGYRCIALDLPPFGYAQRPADAGYTAERQAARILGALDALGLRRVVLIGHSFGGRATMEAALRAPQHLRALVLVDVALGLAPPGDPAATPPPRALAWPWLRNVAVASTATNPLLTRWFLTRFTTRHEALTPARVEVYRRPFAVAGTTAAFGDWAYAFLSDAHRPASAEPAAFRALTVPALVLWGRADDVTPLAQGERIARALPQARLQVLDGIGHIPQVEDNPAFNRALLAFLATSAPLR